MVVFLRSWDLVTDDDDVTTLMTSQCRWCQCWWWLVICMASGGGISVVSMVANTATCLNKVVYFICTKKRNRIVVFTQWDEQINTNNNSKCRDTTTLWTAIWSRIWTTGSGRPKNPNWSQTTSGDSERRLGDVTDLSSGLKRDRYWSIVITDLFNLNRTNTEESGWVQTSYDHQI